MYITGEITTATFALIENTKTLEYKDKRKGPTYRISKTLNSFRSMLNYLTKSHG